MDTPQMPVSTPMPASSSSKLPLILLVLLLILSAGTGGVYLGKYLYGPKIPGASVVAPIVTPTMDPMAGWKTYSDKSYGIFFQFPPAYSYQDKEQNYQQKMAQVNTPISGNHGPSDNTFVFSGESPKFNLVIYSRFPTAGDEQGGIKVAEKPSIKEGDTFCSEIGADKTLEDKVIYINNVPFQKSVQEFNGLTDIRYCAFTDKAYLVGLEIYQVSGMNIDADDKLLAQILSTFQFLK